jgi:hypothetical protein
MSGKWKLAWLCLAVLFLGGTAALAQTITGSVRGTVSDPTGAVVAGAQVTITNTGTGVVGHTVSDKSGLYNFEFLVIGDYTVTATASGFETASIGPFHVQIDQIATANPQLQVGKATTTVSVSGASSALLEAENATVSTSISAATLENMPLNGQNVQIATLFVPGAYNPNSSYMSGAMGTERDAAQGYSEAADAQPSFNGNRQQANSYILDGVDVNETLANSLGYNPSPYSIQEVHVITGNADAEFGNVNGGLVMMVTKGGTNQFHGSAFEFHENSGLTANTWANEHHAVPIRKTSFNQNQFGGAVGGPIIKNKLFFFGNYIGLRYNVPPSQKVTSVPTSAERGIATATGQYDVGSNCPAGDADLTGVQTIEGINFYNTSNGTNNETPYTQNINGVETTCIPISNPVAKFLFASANQALFPLPNAAPTKDTATAGNYVGYQANTTQNNQGDIRIDYSINSKDSLMAKYSYGDAWDNQSQVVIPVLFPYGDDYPFTNAVIAWTRIVSPTIVNNARAGFTRIVINQGAVTDPSGKFGLHGDATLGIPLPNQSVPGFTFMNLGSGDLNNFGTQDLGTFNLDNNFDYNDTVTWVHGKHVTKLGAEFLRYEQDYAAPGNQGGLLGQFSYSGVYTGPEANGSFGYGDFLLDEASGANVAGAAGAFGMRQWRDAAYLQDDWKILPSLTLNLGVRYSYEQPNYEQNNKMVNVNIPLAKFAPLGTSIQTMMSYAGQYNPATGTTNSRALYNPYLLNIMPRFGFAYMVKPRLVVRGGYGVTDELESTGYGLRMTQNPPYLPSFAQTSIPPGATNGGTPFPVENGFATNSSANQDVNGAGYSAWDPNMRPAVIQQFNLTVQYQIDDHTSVQAGYVGNIGQHLAVPLWINQFTEDVPGSAPNTTGSCDTSCYLAIDPFYTLVGAGGDVIETTSRGVSNYHALQATLQRHQAQGLDLLLNYTLGKSMTNNVGYFGVDGFSVDDSFWQNVNNPRGDYGPTSFDVRQAVSASAVYELPFGHGRQYFGNWNRVTDEALGGWQLALTARLNSGLPLSVTQGNNCYNNCPGNADGVQHANQYHPMKITGRGTNSAGVFNWFGTDPSVTPCTSHYDATTGAGTAPNGTCAYGRAQGFGDASVGTLRGPGFQSYDLSLSKGFRVIENENLKVRVDAFNAFNIASYANPNSRISGTASAFGVIGGTQSAPRQLQLSLVYQF